MPSPSCPDNVWYETLDEYIENRDWNGARTHIEPYRDCASDEHQAKLLDLWSKHGLSASQIESIVSDIVDGIWGGFRTVFVWVVVILLIFLGLGLFLAFGTSRRS